MIPWPILKKIKQLLTKKQYRISCFSKCNILLFRFKLQNINKPKSMNNNIAYFNISFQDEATAVLLLRFEAITIPKTKTLNIMITAVTTIFISFVNIKLIITKRLLV